MTTWLLEPNTKEIIIQGERGGLTLTAAQHAEHMQALSGATPDIMAVAGDKAEIAIKGVLTATPNIFAMFLGGGNTTYPDIIAALGAAESDDTISEIILSIDSPGGDLSGLFDTLAAIRATTKPVKAIISNMGASAAYAIAAQADEIIASNRAARIGSIGIAISFRVFEDEVDIASTEAPKKRPDVTTPEGVAIVREELDDLHTVFVDHIVNGRNKATGGNITSKDVNSNFGQGGILLAEAALKQGMIDGIAAPRLAVVGSPSSIAATAKTIKQDEPKSKEGRTMTLKELKVQHPDLFAEVVEAGVAQERDRVVAHLIMGQESGAIETSIEAVKEGSLMTQTLTAKYMMAAKNKATLAATETDDDITAVAVNGAVATGAEAKTDADKVADIVVAQITGIAGVEGDKVNA